MADTTAPRPARNLPPHMVLAATHPATYELAAIEELCEQLQERIERYRREHPIGRCKCPTCSTLRADPGCGSDLHDSLTMIQGALFHGRAMIFNERPLMAGE